MTTVAMDGKTLAVLATLLLLSEEASAILNQDNPDVTNDYNFNCRWRGGSDPSLECNCLSGSEEFVIKENSIPPYDVAAITIRNCGKITLQRNAISNMRSLRAVTLERVKAIVLEADSLHWLGEIRNGENLVDWDPTVPSIKIRILSSAIERIANNAIHGRINLLELTDSTVRHVSPFAVGNLQQTISVHIDGCAFHALEPQSFKKFTTKKLVIANTVFYAIPSRAFYELIVNEQFVLDNVTILDALKPSGFIVSKPYTFELLNSHINHMSGSGLNVATRGGVLIRNNRFNDTASGAFRSITLCKEDPNEFESIRFEHNVFDHLSKDALVVDADSFRADFSGLQLTEACECGNLERYFRHGENTLELSCMAESATERGAKEWMSVDAFQRARCGLLDTRSGTAYIVAGACAIVLVLAGGLVGFYFLRLQRSKSYGGGSADKNGKLSMIVPDGRTYRETELCVIVERADLLTTDL